MQTDAQGAIYILAGLLSTLIAYGLYRIPINHVFGLRVLHGEEQLLKRG
jgi:hypothetical protein